MDEAFFDVAEGIRKVIEQLITKSYVNSETTLARLAEDQQPKTSKEQPVTSMEDSFTKMPYNDLLRRERQIRLLSQEHLAEVIDADSRLVRAWESGRSMPSYRYRQRLCEFYGKSAEELGLLSRK